MGFVKSTMPKGEYKQEETFGDITFVRFGATENGEIMEFYETCVPTSEYDKTKVEEEYNTYIAQVKQTELQNAITEKKKEIMEYDSKEGEGAVNNFYFQYNGTKYSYWFNAYERTALTSEATQWAKKYGKYRIDARKYGVYFEVDCDTLLDWLGQLKDYAGKEPSKEEPKEETAPAAEKPTVEDVNNYDYKSGYPENIVFVVA